MTLAKITRPTLIATVARPRLFRQLDRAGRRPVTWVWAPPGAGKTTLVASYVAYRKVRHLWYQIDRSDNVIATFFYYLGQAAPQRRRPLALLKALIAFGGQDVAEERLLEALWPHADVRSARFSLTSAIYRQRRLLECDKAIVRREGKVSISAEHAWVDLWALEGLLDRIEGALSSAAGKKSAARETVQWIKWAGAIHRGAFLGGETESRWAAPVAEQIRRRLLRQFVRAGRLCEQLEEWEDAIGYYERGFAIDPCAEDVCRCLIKAYYRLGRRIDAFTVYNHCRQALEARLGVAPTAKTRAWLKKLTRQEMGSSIELNSCNLLY